MVKRYNSILARCVSNSGFIVSLAVFGCCCFQKLAFQNPERFAGFCRIQSIVADEGHRLI